MRWLLSLLLLTACDSDSSSSAYADSTLPPGSATTAEELSGARRDWAGQVSAEAATGGFTLRVDQDKAADVEIQVSSPTGVDPTILDGVAATAVSVARDGVSNVLSVSVSDIDGPVYILENTQPDVLTARDLGPSFVRRAEDTGTATLVNGELTIFSATVATDEGPLEVFPGEPVEIEVNDRRYRFVLLANWDRVPNDGVSCRVDDIMAYELLLLGEKDQVDTTPLERIEAVELDGQTCTG